MPVNMQALRTITSAEDLNQLKLDANNQLQKRSGIATFFRNLGDAFLRLSQSGRAAIAQRQDAVMDAVRKTVNDARKNDVPQEVKDMRTRLNEATNRLTEYAVQSRQKSFNDFLSALQSDRRFKALPEAAQHALQRAYAETTASTSPAKWSERFDSLNSYFFGTAPKSYNLQEGLRLFADDLVHNEGSGFTSPTQQRHVKEDGIHSSFIKDTNRRCIDTFNGERVPNVGEADLPQYCTARLRDILGEEHRNIMPFVTMMASQAGVDSAMSFLPGFSGICEEGGENMLAARFYPDITLGTHKIDIRREGDILTITSTFSQGYRHNKENTLLSCKGDISMHIDLSVPPAVHQTDNGQQIFIPEFTLTSTGVTIESE